MPPKGKAAKGKGNAGEMKEAGTFTEVEKAIMDLQIAKVNSKNARLLQSVSDYEIKLEELQTAYEILDKDRADVIAYLKNQLAAKSEENTELKERVKVLEELKEIETQKFKETVADTQKHFKIMKDQLSSENRMLAGKLNTLEELRAIRDDLIMKFKHQEEASADQELKIKRQVYEAEKKFVVVKDKLKRDMETKFKELAQKFEDTTSLRIATSTHRAIRMNIAFNTELDSILHIQSKLAEQNEKYRENETSARIAKELAEEERDKTIKKNVVQLKVIGQLTAAFDDVKKERALYEKRKYDFDMLQTKIQKLSEENENLSLQARILEQNLHARLTDQNKASVESTKITIENNKLKKIFKDAAASLKAALKQDKWAGTDKSRELMDRQVLLGHLLEIVTQYHDVQQSESIDTLASHRKIYEEGDLGFVPKPVGKKKVVAPKLTPKSKQSLTKAPGKKRSTPTISSSFESPLGSLKTIPSIQLIAQLSEQEITVNDSLASFAESSRSSESARSVEVEEEEDEDASKLEIQKSIMKDLAASVATMPKKRLSQFLEPTIKEKGEDDLKMEEKEGEEHVHFSDKEKAEGATKAEKESNVEGEEAEEGRK